MTENDTPQSSRSSTMTNNNKSSNESSQSVLWNRLVLSILITETAERVAYFGFRAVLVLYFTHDLHFSDATAVSLCAGTVALAYLSPLLGAVLADSSWGRFSTIWRFGCMYVLGLWLLTFASYGVPNYEEEISDEDTTEETTNQNLGLERTLTFLGLFLVCMGTGGIKPCVSAFGADQVVLNEEEETSNSVMTKKGKDTFIENPPVEGSTQITSNREERIREFFNSFYFCINVGALGSYAIIPLVRSRWGFTAAFLIPTLFMMVALLVFGSQQNSFKHRKRDDSQPSLLEVFQVCIVILKQRLYQSTCYRCISTALGSSDGTSGEHELVSSEDNDQPHDASDLEDERTKHQVHQDASQALHILPLMAFFPIFWMLYDQQGSVWTLQATRLNLHGLEPEQLNVLNPLEIMIFIPLFDLKIYPWLERRGFNIQPVRRMKYGMFLAAVSFLMSAWLEHRMQSQPPLTVSVALQIPQITVLTVAEILLNVTGLEFAYSQAPSNMQALILALYLFMTAIGNGLGALLYGSVFAHLSSTTAMMVCAICMLVNLGFFWRVARHWKPYHPQQLDGTSEVGLELGPVNHVEHQH